MIVLARGSGLTLQLHGVLERHWGAGKTRPIAYISSLTDLAGVATTGRNPAGQPVARKQFLVVDIETCAGDESAVVSEWTLAHSDILPVLIVTRLVPPQMRVVDGVKLAEPRAVVICGEEVGNDPVWDRIFRRQLSFRIGPQIHADLGAITALTPTVAAILLAASETSSVKELCAIIQRERTAVFDQLKQAHQRPPKELLLLFRALYSAKLRELGWTPTNIARYLGHANPRNSNRELARGLGVGAELFDQPYRRLLALVKAVLPAQEPLEEAVQQFLQGANLLAKGAT